MGKRRTQVETGHVITSQGAQAATRGWRGRGWDPSSGGSMALPWLVFRLVTSGNVEELVAFRPLGMKSFVMAATGNSYVLFGPDVPFLCILDVSADTHFLVAVWVTPAPWRAST